MKSIQIMLLNVLLLGGLTLSTCNKARATEFSAAQLKKEITAELSNKIGFPEALLDQPIHERVLLVFKVNAKMQVCVLNVSGRNDYLNTYLKQQVEGLKLQCLPEPTNETMEVGIQFTNEIP